MLTYLPLGGGQTLQPQMSFRMFVGNSILVFDIQSKLGHGRLVDRFNL